MKNRIAVLVVYFGKLPIYLHIFINGCAANSSIDYIIITDDKDYGNIRMPSNCYIHIMTLASASKLASERLGLSIDIKWPYKLCDFRPVFGLIFKSYLVGYDFWGWCDMDIVFGNIRKYATDEVLEGCDVFTCNDAYVSGPFTLVRNNSIIERIVLESPDFNCVATDSGRYYGFDECAGCWNALAKGQSILDLNPPIRSFTEILVLSERDGTVRWYRKHLIIEDVTSDVTVERGHVYMGGDEKLLLHFVCLKAGMLFTFPQWDEVPKSYIVNRWGVFLPGERTGIIALLSGSRRRRTILRLIDRLNTKIRKGLQMVLKGNIRGVFRHFFRRFIDRWEM